MVRRYQDRIGFVGMAGRGSTADIQAFVDRHGLQDMQTVVDETGELWTSFGVFGQPAWVFVDDTGAHDVYQSALPEDELERVLDELIAS